MHFRVGGFAPVGSEKHFANSFWKLATHVLAVQARLAALAARTHVRVASL